MGVRKENERTEGRFIEKSAGLTVDDENTLAKFTAGFILSGIVGCFTLTLVDACIKNNVNLFEFMYIVSESFKASIP